MRKLILMILAVGAIHLAFGQSDGVGGSRPEGAQLSWEKTFYDFGEVTQGDKVEYTFRFTNSGNQPLVITNVTTQCGCTAPRGWPRDPVEPGDRGEITLVFDSSGKFGRVNKVATVVSNAVNKNGSQLLISGSILEKKTTAYKGNR